MMPVDSVAHLLHGEQRAMGFDESFDEIVANLGGQFHDAVVQCNGGVKGRKRRATADESYLFLLPPLRRSFYRCVPGGVEK